MTGPQPLVTWRVTDAERPSYGGIWVGPLGECGHAACPRKGTQAVEWLGADTQIPGPSPQGFCGAHVPQLIDQAEAQPSGAGIGMVNGCGVSGGGGCVP